MTSDSLSDVNRMACVIYTQTASNKQQQTEMTANNKQQQTEMTANNNKQQTTYKQTDCLYVFKNKD